MSPVVEHDPAEKLRAFAHPERLVTTGWLASAIQQPPGSAWLKFLAPTVSLGAD